MARTLTRRALLTRGALLAGAAACGLGTLRSLVYAQGRAPIRIGFIADITGTVAQSGRDMLDGFQLYLAEKGSAMAGRPVDLVVEDAAGVPANALTKAQKLVEQDRVHILTAPLLASEGYAIRDYIAERNMPTLFAVCSADDLTQRKRAPVIIRTGWSSSQPSHPFGEWVAKTLRYKRVATIGSDYAFRFTKAYRQYGLKGRIPLIGGGVLMDESLLRGMDPADAEGTITALMWSAALPTPQAQRFVAAYRAKYQKDPS